MFMYQSKEWTGFNRAFYKKLLMVFGLLTLLAGLVQLALGAYVFDKVRLFERYKGFVCRGENVVAKTVYHNTCIS